jgi:hypothetical protein
MDVLIVDVLMLIYIIWQYLDVEVSYKTEWSTVSAEDLEHHARS